MQMNENANWMKTIARFLKFLLIVVCVASLRSVPDQTNTICNRIRNPEKLFQDTRSRIRIHNNED
jgi:hypothetical protein